MGVITCCKIIAEFQIWKFTCVISVGRTLKKYSVYLSSTVVLLFSTVNFFYVYGLKCMCSHFSSVLRKKKWMYSFNVHVYFSFRQLQVLPQTHYILI